MKQNVVRYNDTEWLIMTHSSDLSALRMVHEDAEVAWDRDCADVVIIPHPMEEVPDLRIIDARRAGGTCEAWCGEFGTRRLAIWHDDLLCWIPCR